MGTTIKNFGALALTPARRAALTIAEAGLAAIDTRAAVRAAVRLEAGRLCVLDKVCSLAGTERVYLAGIGKCAREAAAALEDVLGDRLAGGLVVGVGDDGPTLRRTRYVAGTHPLPTDQNVAAARAVVELLDGLTANDLVIIIVSGGGSTLLCLPEAGATCVEEGLVLRQLFRAGASIQEINTIRKHLSLARGGYLARYAYPAQVIGLVFSDVPGNDLQTIASGPTVLDTTTIADADAVLAKYGILQACGLEHCGLIETPKDPKYFERVQNTILVSNRLALEAMAARARALGFAATISTDCLAGEAREVGERVAAELHGSPAGTARLYGGETTVTVRGPGPGGRNQELALAALAELSAGEVVLALASDGHDNTDAAGALCDTMTRERAAALGLDAERFLRDNSSYPFFQQTGDFLETGATGANVADLLIALSAL